MIISASRRTDIPAFHSAWFMNAIAAGYCDVANPRNPRQASRVSLLPEDVDVIVFWTRNPRPMFGHLPELDRRGYKYYFLFTIMDNLRELEPGAPRCGASIETAGELSSLVGSGRVVWRYDPILLNAKQDARFHVSAFTRIAESLRGSVSRCIISIADPYPKVQRRLAGLGPGWEISEEPPDGSMLARIGESARENGMEIFSCAEKMDMAAFGIRHGKCIDNELIFRLFGIDAGSAKDPGQREECGCVASKDIGAYNTCSFGCVYCYAS